MNRLTINYTGDIPPLFDVNRGVQLRPNGEAWEKQENKASCSFFWDTSISVEIYD
jgi:hypothetical protein